MRYGRVVLMLSVLALPACATAPAGGGDSSASRDVLEADAIRAAGSQIRTALEAVEQLRPHFLRTRATPTIGSRRVDPVVVYVDGVRRGGAQALAQVRVEHIIRIVYVRPSSAQTRYGLDHGSGAIEVVTSSG